MWGMCVWIKIQFTHPVAFISYDILAVVVGLTD